MRDLLFLLFSIIVTCLKLLKPGGVKSLISENASLKLQILVQLRKKKSKPKMLPRDRILFGFLAIFMPRNRVEKIAALFSPATILKFHRLLVKRKYRLLFSSISNNKPGPKGPSREIIELTIKIKTKNPRFGCPRIADLVNRSLGTDIDQNVISRIIKKYYRPKPGGGPSWLTTIGHAVDSLWSLDFLCVESSNLKTYWIMLVMDQFTRKIVGVAVFKGALNGPAICQMLNEILSGKHPPKRLSFDHDQLFKYHQWRANLDIYEIDSIQTVPYVPWSHPFIERLIGTLRREYLDNIFFLNGLDLKRKLEKFAIYFNDARPHQSLSALTPNEKSNSDYNKDKINGKNNKVTWKSYCNHQFQVPIAA